MRIHPAWPGFRHARRARPPASSSCHIVPPRSLSAPANRALGKIHRSQTGCALPFPAHGQHCRPATPPPASRSPPLSAPPGAALATHGAARAPPLSRIVQMRHQAEPAPAAKHVQATAIAPAMRADRQSAQAHTRLCRIRQALGPAVARSVHQGHVHPLSFQAHVRHHDAWPDLWRTAADERRHGCGTHAHQRPGQRLTHRQLTFRDKGTL